VVSVILNRAVELDDIFFQAIFRRSNQRIVELIRNAEEKYRSVIEQQLADVNASYQSFESSGSGRIVADEGSDRSPKAFSREVHKQLIFEEELKQALGVNKVVAEPPASKRQLSTSSYPIATAVGRATFAALGLAAKVCVLFALE